MGREGGGAKGVGTEGLKEKGEVGSDSGGLRQAMRCRRGGGFLHCTYDPLEVRARNLRESWLI